MPMQLTVSDRMYIFLGPINYYYDQNFFLKNPFYFMPFYPLI